MQRRNSEGAVAKDTGKRNKKRVTSFWSKPVRCNISAARPAPTLPRTQPTLNFMTGPTSANDLPRDDPILEEVMGRFSLPSRDQLIPVARFFDVTMAIARFTSESVSWPISGFASEGTAVKSNCHCSFTIRGRQGFERVPPSEWESKHSARSACVNSNKESFL